MGFFKYIVTLWDDFEEKESVAKGLIYAKNYAEAAGKLENYYNIVVITGLYALEEGEVYDIDFNKDDKCLFKINAEEI